MRIENDKDLVKADERLNLNKLSADEIYITYIDDIWDGPLSGACTWHGKDYYFYCFDQLEADGNTDRWPRKYVLLYLTPEQDTERNRQHDIYKNWRLGLIDQKNYHEQWKAFPKIVIKSEQIVGWFESESANRKPSRFLESYFAWIKNNGNK